MIVEIWSDITCNYCYTAKRKFEIALSQFKDHNKIEVIWRSFELAPGLKTDPGKFLPQFLQQLHGISLERVQVMIDQVTQSAKQAGLDFDLSRTIPANSFKAHRLSHFSRTHGLQNEIEERMFKAYFIEGKNIDDNPTLIDLAKEIGLNASEVKAVLESGEYANEVNRDLAEARQFAITSVPTYIFNNNTKVSGVRDSSVYSEILEKEFIIWEKQVKKTASNR